MAQSETEGAKFWLACLTDLKERGVEDIFIVCVDGLSGFPEAIRAAFPQTKVQLCIVHLVRAALKYVTDTDSREVATGPQDDLSVGDGVGSRRVAGEVRGEVGIEVPDNREAVAGEVEARSSRCSSSRRRFAKRSTRPTRSSGVNSVIRKFTRNRKQYPNGESCVEVGVPGDSRGVEEMDDAD